MKRRAHELGMLIILSSVLHAFRFCMADELQERDEGVKKIKCIVHPDVVFGKYTVVGAKMSSDEMQVEYILKNNLLQKFTSCGNSGCLCDHIPGNYAACIS